MALLAQLVERQAFNLVGVGSSPTVGAKFLMIGHSNSKIKPIFVDFAEGKNAHRSQFGGGISQPVAKAVGLNKQRSLHIFDATAGMGADSFVFASVGAKVTLCEQHPVVHALLEDGLHKK